MPRFAGGYAFAATVFLVALALRPTLASVGPLLTTIQGQTGLSELGASLLTTLPVALMGLFLLVTARLQTLLGSRSGIAAGLLLIALSALWRWIGVGANALVVTAIIGGIGIALVQALIPAVIRARGATATASLMGLYSTGIMAGALISSALSPWIADVWGWPAGLGIWTLAGIVGLFAWWRTVPGQEIAPRTGKFSPVQSPRAWLLMVFFGLGTGAYTLVLAWLPPYYTGLGWSPQAAGALLAALTLAEVVAGFAVTLWVDRSPDRRPALLLSIGAMLIGLVLLIVAPLPLAWPAAALAGLGIGALFPLSLIVAIDHGEDAASSGAIVGFVQGGGYLLAAVLPFVAGLLLEELSSLTPAWILMAALSLLLAIIALRFRPGARLSLAS